MDGPITAQDLDPVIQMNRTVLQTCVCVCVCVFRFGGVTSGGWRR